MKLSGFRDSPATRLMLVIALTGVIDGIVVWFAPHPLPWAAFIGASVPLTMSLFVIMPMIRKNEQQRLLAQNRHPADGL